MEQDKFREKLSDIVSHLDYNLSPQQIEATAGFLGELAESFIRWSSIYENSLEQQRQFDEGDFSSIEVSRNIMVSAEEALKSHGEYAIGYEHYDLAFQLKNPNYSSRKTDNELTQILVMWNSYKTDKRSLWFICTGIERVEGVINQTLKRVVMKENIYDHN